MKKIKFFFAGLALLIAVGSAQAQQAVNVGQALRGLINVDVGAVAVNVGDITVEDLVNVEDVLNDLQVDILNNAVNNNEVASRNQNFLNNLLREADLITDNQVVVGVLSGQYIIQDL